MSVEYIMDPLVTVPEFLEACQVLKINRVDDEDATDRRYPITDENSYAWVSYYEWEGLDYVQFTIFSGNSDALLYDIAEYLNVSCWCEYDEEFHNLVDEGNGDHGDFMTINVEELMEMATEVYEIKDGKMVPTKKGGENVH